MPVALFVIFWCRPDAGCLLMTQGGRPVFQTLEHCRDYLRREPEAADDGPPKFNASGRYVMTADGKEYLECRQLPKQAPAEATDKDWADLSDEFKRIGVSQ